jgi:hypothetical protein
VDLPGIIQFKASNSTGGEEENPTDYMKNPRSIILAVISAANDFNNQVVVKLARRIDPTGSRTLGVITKPDRIDTPEGVEAIREIASNKTVEFALGWHVLRSKSDRPEERKFYSRERDIQEKRFFKTARWNTLDPNILGIDNLVHRLSKLLAQRFEQGIPHVVSQIEQKLDSCRKELEAVGEGYGDVTQMRNGTHKWCKESTDYVIHASEGSYKNWYNKSFFDRNSADADIR